VVGAALVLYWRIRSSSVALVTPTPESTTAVRLRGELTFMSDQEGTWDVFTLDPDGNLRNLTGDGAGQDYFPAWAFQSDMVNFLTGRSGEMGPAQVEPDGSNLHTLGIAEAIMSTVLAGRIDWDPNWSPDGRRLLVQQLDPRKP
jgi:Tol biopolymer transport system component